MFITGLSMGGFGALRIGAKYPQLFKGFSGHSSITKLAEMGDFVEESLEEYQQRDSENETVIGQMARNQSSLPPFRFDCGLEDNL